MGLFFKTVRSIQELVAVGYIRFCKLNDYIFLFWPQNWALQFSHIQSYRGQTKLNWRPNRKYPAWKHHRRTSAPWHCRKWRHPRCTRAPVTGCWRRGRRCGPQQRCFNPYIQVTTGWPSCSSASLPPRGPGGRGRGWKGGRMKGLKDGKMNG